MLPLPLGKSPCFPLSFYKAESYPDAWIQDILWLNSQCHLTILDSLPQPCHNLSTGPHSEDFLPGGLFSSSFRVAWPQVTWPQSIHLSTHSKGQNRTCHPNLHPFLWRAGNISLPVILQVSALLEEQKNSLSQALESLIFCQTEMKNKPNLSCHRIMKCLWLFYQSM